MKKQCPICDATFFGRKDKRFCSDACRNQYHNRKNSESNNLMRNINNVLRRNRRILASLNPQGKAKVSRTKLLESGFNFRYFTNIYTTKAGKIYHFVYEQGYLDLEDDHVALVVRQEYVD